MKICAIICEYNPFHNGHLYHIQEAKRLSGADYILCLMSGNFVQRGEAAILGKCTRAKHAVLAGADVVIELPSVYATSNAEIFAKGAVQLLSSIPAVTTLCFGAENADAKAILQTAQLLNNEPAEVSKQIKKLTDEGVSYVKARATAWGNLLPADLMLSPNNILGLEYTRAILKNKANISILPIPRLGNDYNSTDLNGDFASATAIRQAISEDASTDKYLPSFVFKDLPKQITNRLEYLEKYAILSKPANEIARVCDCNEGLENAFKKAALSPASLVEQLTSARYTSSRIRRIALQNLLGIEESFIRDCLATNLYLRVLACNANKKEVLSAISTPNAPIILRGYDANALSGVAKQCLEKDNFAESIYQLLHNLSKKEKNIFWTV